MVFDLSVLNRVHNPCELGLNPGVIFRVTLTLKITTTTKSTIFLAKHFSVFY